jgi:hypothetical protein
VGHRKGHAKGKVPTLKTETSQINNLMIYTKLQDKQEQTNPQTSKWREIIKIGLRLIR